VGLLVGELHAGGVPAVEPRERRNAVLHGRGLALLREVDLPQRLVPAPVHVASLQAQAYTGAAVGAVTQTRGVDAALGRGQRHRDRHALAGPVRPRRGLVGARLDVDAAEVVQGHQRCAQPVELALVVVAAFVPVHKLVEQGRIDDLVGRLLEADAAQVVADAAVPALVDVGRVFGARHLDPAREEVGIEVAALGQAPADAGLAGVVQAAVEDRAWARQEGEDLVLHVRIARGLALDGDVAVAHAHWLAGNDGDGDDPGLAVALHRDFGRVIAERPQGLAGLVP